MIRIATKADIPHVAATYCELLTYEQEHGTHSNWVLDVYPTEETAETAFQRTTFTYWKKKVLSVAVSF